jgi:hypothetical protein
MICHDNRIGYGDDVDDPVQKVHTVAAESNILGGTANLGVVVKIRTLLSFQALKPLLETTNDAIQQKCKPFYLRIGRRKGTTNLLARKVSRLYLFLRTP